MGKITEREIKNLLDALRGATPAAPREEQRKYHADAVWYGDWFRKADVGRFGSEKKPKHFAAIMSRSKPESRFTLAPITSLKSDAAVVLPAGLLPGATKLTVSFMLIKIKLQASRETLDTYFQYRCSLSPEYVQQAKERIRDDGKR